MIILNILCIKIFKYNYFMLIIYIKKIFLHIFPALFNYISYKNNILLYFTHCIFIII